MQIIVNEKIHLIDCPPDKRKLIEQKLSLPNPMYWKLKAMKKWLGNTPQYFDYFEQKGNDFIIPRGLLPRVKKFFPEVDIAFDTVNQSSNLVPWLADIVLRDYQDEIMTSWRENKPEQGVFNLGTGTGKTILALQLIKELGKKATIIVPTNIILDQFVAEAKRFWNYDLGIINGKVKKIEDVTVVCVASLFDNDEILNELISQTSVLIVDECHSFLSDKRIEVIEKFKPEYLYGLSGSPAREDGQTDAIFFYFGEIIEKYELTAINPVVEVVDPKVFIPVSVNYHEMIDQMITSKDRNKQIAWHIWRELNANRKCLVLTKRVEHYKLLRELLPEGDGIITADSDNNDLGDILDDFRTNKKDFKCILGTFSLLGTGFNLEKLDTLIIAGDLKSQILTTQSAGRVLRALDGKTARIVDFWDRGNGMLSKQYKEREKLYQSKGWEVITPFDNQKKLNFY